jgi:hypothetical protein
MAVVFPAPAGADRQLHTGTRCAHLPDQCRLPGIQGGAVRRHLQQRQLHPRLIDHCPIAASRGGNEPLLGVEDPMRCIEIGPSHGVDRGSVCAPQRVWVLDVVSRCAQCDRAAIQHLID